MRDLIIGCSNNYDWSKIKYWINSVNSSGFTGEKVLLVMNCDKNTAAKVNEAGFNLAYCGTTDNAGNFVYKSNMPVHTERFLHLYNYIKNNGPYRFIVTTDVRDVVFQRNPIEYLEQHCQNKNLIFPSESIQYKNEAWNNQNLLQTYGEYIHSIFKENEVYNVGVLGGKGDAIQALALNIFTNCTNRPIPICDQSTFNFMIMQKPYTDTSVYAKSEDGWAAQLGTTADPEKINKFRPHLLEAEPILIEDQVSTSSGNPHYIVHQYDRVPNWKNIIENKYGD